MEIEVYTDGSATIASKPGGFGWVLVIDGIKHSEGNGHIPRATNNDAEMEAAIHGLAAVLKFVSEQPDHIRPSVSVTLCSDSQITLGWANGSYRFKQQAKYHRFEILKHLVARLKAKTKWVRGHSGHEWNERCDVLANLGRNNLAPEHGIIKRRRSKKKSIGKEKGQIAVFSYRNMLKIVDFENNLMEDYSAKRHGERQTLMELSLGEDK
jgi:ribonuclease HI